MESKRVYSLRQYVADIAHYVRPYKKRFFVGVLFRLSSDLAHLYPAYALSRIVLLLSHTPLDKAALQQLLGIFGLWGAITLYFAVAQNFAKLLGYQVAEKASLNLYKDCLAHIFRLDLAWQELESSGNKLKRIDRGLDGINLSIRRVFDVLIEVAVNTVGIIFIFSTLNLLLSTSLVFFIVTYFLIGTAFLKRALEAESEVNQGFENLSGVTYEALTNVNTIKSLAIDQGIVSAVDLHLATLFPAIRKRIFRYQSQGAILSLYILIFQFVTIGLLARSILLGYANISLLILFIGLFDKVTSSTGELTDVVQELGKAKLWVSRATEILHTQPKIEGSANVAKTNTYPADWQTLNVNNVRFSYEKGSGLKDISFTVKRREKVGIVGLSGAGKSTLFKLLLDLYENYDGEICLGKIPLKTIRRQSYIDHVAIVLQDTELFNMSLKDNIAISSIGRKREAERLLENTISMAHLDEVVASLPQGAETVVGEKGTKLSGGQRQRVGIARALYRQPDILLLDEATSSLDTHSEHEIQAALAECMQPFTAIVIAHRLSTIKSMDKILVLDKGCLVEQGTFGELLAKQGLFAAMWEEQKL